MIARWGIFLLVILGVFLCVALKMLVPIFGILTPDAARDLAQAWKVAHGQLTVEGPLIGNTLHIGPGYFYLLALPLTFGGSATVALCFLSLCTLAGSFFAYRLGALLWDREIGVAFLFLFASDYWASLTSLSVANVDLLPSVSLGFLWAIALTTSPHRIRGLFWSLVCAAGAMQIHPIAATLFPLWLLAVRQDSRPQRLLLRGVAVGVLLSTPWLWTTLQARSGTQGLGFASMPTLLAQFWSLGPQLASFWSQAIPLPNVRSFLLWMQESLPYLAIGGILVLIVDGARRKSYRPSLFLLAWAGTFWLFFPPLLALARSGYGIPDKVAGWYYYFPLQPLIPLLTAFLAVKLPRQVLSQRLAKRVTWSVVGGLSLSSAVLTLWSVVALASRGFVEAQTYPYLPPGRLPYFTSAQEEAMTKQLRHWSQDGTIGISQLHGWPLVSYVQNRGILYWMHSLAIRPLTQAPFQVVGMRRDEVGGVIKGEDQRDIGPFVLVKYHSALDYHSLRFRTKLEPGWQDIAFDDNPWQEVSLPSVTRLPQPGEYPSPPDMTWEDVPVYLRGTFVRARGESLMAGVTFPAVDGGRFQGRLCGLFVNGKPVENMSNNAPFWQIVPLDGYASEGRNMIALCAEGDRHMIVDVFIIAVE